MPSRRRFLKSSLAGLAWPLAGATIAAEPGADPPPDVLIVVGPSTHPPGTHEVAAGGRLMQHCLQHMDNLPGVRANVVDAWPHEQPWLERVRSLVFIGDIFPPQRMPETDAILAEIGRMMGRGCGIACIHYATGLRAEDVAADGEHPLLHWMGGYFATRCPHHQSTAKVFEAATIEPAAADHPVSRGWQAFTLHDEPYINNYFGPDGNRPGKRVTVLATSQLPPESPRAEAVAWGIEREDGGRGFGVVMPHFYRNWSDDSLRRLILNGLVWSAGYEVPADGVRTSPPELTAFGAAAVDPQPRKK